MKKRFLYSVLFPFIHIVPIGEYPTIEKHASISSLIIVNSSLWFHSYTTPIYITLVSILTILTLRHFIFKKQQKRRNAQIRVFIDAAHGMRTPLALLKTPLEKLRTKKGLTEEETVNISTALKNVDTLLDLTTDLAGLEEADTKSVSRTRNSAGEENLCENGAAMEESAPNGVDADPNFTAIVNKHIEKNIDNQSFNVDTLCGLMGMSRTSFYNKLKSVTDQAPADYIRLNRLEYAIRLLKEGRHNITEISEMTGFNDARYFRQVFKRHFKVSPSQYCKKNKGNKKEGEPQE